MKLQLHDNGLDRLRLFKRKQASRAVSRAKPPVIVPGTDRASRFFRACLEPAVTKAITRKMGGALPTLCVADIGCGYGFWLERFVHMGIEPSRLSGIDCNAERVQSARQRVPGANIEHGYAQSLPYPSASFDVVTQFTLFSSVLSHIDRVHIAAEMRRVLRPGGAIVWYDFFAPNPRNRATRSIPRGEIRALFPGCDVSLQRVTLAPPIARLSLRVSESFARRLDRLAALRTHYFGVIQCHG